MKKRSKFSASRPHCKKEEHKKENRVMDVGVKEWRRGEQKNRNMKDKYAKKYEHHLHNGGMDHVNEACADHWLHDILRYSTRIISLGFFSQKRQPR